MKNDYVLTSPHTVRATLGIWMTFAVGLLVCLHRLEDNIKTGRKDLEWDGVYRIRPAHYRDQWQALYREHGNVAKLLAEFCCENETTGA